VPKGGSGLETWGIVLRGIRRTRKDCSCD